MSKKSFFLMLFAAFLQVWSTVCSAGARVKEKEVPAELSSGLDHLLRLVGPENSETLVAASADHVLQFVANTSTHEAAYCPGKRDGVPSAYYHFDIRADMDTLLQYCFHPRIPMCALIPSSIRCTSWAELQEEDATALERRDFHGAPDLSLTIKGMELQQCTPSPSVGAYYGYQVDRTLIWCMHRGCRVLISLSRQRGRSCVGKKGAILGSDNEWDYLYSQKTGIGRAGLGWARSYVNKAFSVIVYYETDSSAPLIRCGIFRWVKAGWGSINMVARDDIREGLERFAMCFKGIMEDPRLPGAPSLEAHYGELQAASTGELDQRLNEYVGSLGRLYTRDPAMRKKHFRKLIRGDAYVRGMTRVEKEGLLMVRFMKNALGR